MRIFLASTVSVAFVLSLSAVHIPVQAGPSSEITRAVRSAAAGDHIVLGAGRFTGIVEITGSGRPDDPLVISGTVQDGERRTVIDGLGVPGKDKDAGAFKFAGAAWIVLRDVVIQNAWLHPVEIEDSSYISIIGCDIRGGKTAVNTLGAKTHHILVENNLWSQDERIYTELDWNELHHGALAHFNGGIYGGDGAGGAIIRHNRIRDVFNGLRYYMSSDAGKTRQRQSNIEVYDNTFVRCRDNAIEPEIFAWNLHVYHNRMDSCTLGAFSIDAVTGGNIFLYGNTGIWKRDGAGESNAWTLYKFALYQKKAELDSPLLIAHNSFHTGFIFVKHSRGFSANDHVSHYNNAYQHQEERHHLGLISWPGKHCAFDYDLSSRPFHPDVRSAGFEKNGIDDILPGFLDPENGDFRLLGNSPAIDRGRVIDGFTLWYTGSAPDIGAYENGGRVYGAPFRNTSPPGGDLYNEKSRIVRIFRYADRLLLFFSAGLNPEKFDGRCISLAIDGNAIPVKRVTLPDPYIISIESASPLPSQTHMARIGMTPFPVGMNGETCTHWGEDMRIVTIPRTATLAGTLSSIIR